MDPDPLDVLKAKYPAWRVWPGRGTRLGIVYARKLKTSPPVILRDRTARGLRAQMDEFVRVYAETNSRAEAMTAARALDTSGLG